jgi:hypothetical protein
MSRFSRKGGNSERVSGTEPVWLMCLQGHWGRFHRLRDALWITALLKTGWFRTSLQLSLLRQNAPPGQSVSAGGQGNGVLTLKVPVKTSNILCFKEPKLLARQMLPLR